MTDWDGFINAQQDADYFKGILAFLEQEAQSNNTVYPQQTDIFNAFKWCDLASTKVVILGQDPYHGEGQAHGLAFSVQENCAIPPSLRNIFKELERSVDGFEQPQHGNLQHWAKQGVMLLNTVLTVRHGEPNSHVDIGWQHFTYRAIELINASCPHVVFMLWGAHAQKQSTLIDSKKHCVLKAPHPSPLSAHRGFHGCNHFELANQWLHKRAMSPIQW